MKSAKEVLLERMYCSGDRKPVVKKNKNDLADLMNSERNRNGNSEGASFLRTQLEYEGHSKNKW